MASRLRDNAGDAAGVVQRILKDHEVQRHHPGLRVVPAQLCLEEGFERLDVPHLPQLRACGRAFARHEVGEYGTVHGVGELVGQHRKFQPEGVVDRLAQQLDERLLILHGREAVCKHTQRLVHPQAQQRVHIRHDLLAGLQQALRDLQGPRARAISVQGRRLRASAVGTLDRSRMLNT